MPHVSHKPVWEKHSRGRNWKPKTYDIQVCGCFINFACTAREIKSILKNLSQPTTENMALRKQEDKFTLGKPSDQNIYSARILALLLGDHFFTWKVEPHLPTCCCRCREHCSGRNRWKAVGLHGKKLARPRQGHIRTFHVWAGGPGRSGGGCGAQLHSCSVLKRVLTCLYFECCSACQPSASH